MHPNSSFSAPGSQMCACFFQLMNYSSSYVLSGSCSQDSCEFFRSLLTMVCSFWPFWKFLSGRVSGNDLDQMDLLFYFTCEVNSACRVDEQWSSFFVVTDHLHDRRKVPPQNFGDVIILQDGVSRHLFSPLHTLKKKRGLFFWIALKIYKELPPPHQVCLDTKYVRSRLQSFAFVPKKQFATTKQSGKHGAFYLSVHLLSFSKIKLSSWKRIGEKQFIGEHWWCVICMWTSGLICDRGYFWPCLRIVVLLRI